MASVKRRMTLGEQIAAILRARRHLPHAATSGCQPSVKRTLACGSMMLLALNPGHVGAVGFGDMRIESRLGQPLAAAVPLRLLPGESLAENCVRAGPATDAFGAPPGLRVEASAFGGPGVFTVRVSTAKPLHEPIYELSLMIKCQGVPLLVRQYVLMLDLPGMPVANAAPEPAANPDRVTSSGLPAMPALAGNPTARPTRREPATDLSPRTDAIAAGSRYRVSIGDTLSTIARRVAGRLPNTTWRVAEKIFAANPDAFIRDDRNLIKLGSLVRIPDSETLAAMLPAAQDLPPPAAAVFTAATTTPATAAPGPVVDTQAIEASRGVAAASATPAASMEPLRLNGPQAPVPAAAEANDADTDSTTFGPPVEPAAPAASTAADDTATLSPFADERPGTNAVDAPADTPVVSPAPVADTPAPAVQAERFSVLRWLLLGLLFAAGLGLFVARNRLLEAWRTHRRGAMRARRGSASGTGAFDESMAAAAFVRSSPKLDTPRPLPISGPAENTYIVETAEPGPIAEQHFAALRDVAPQSDPVAPPAPTGTGSLVGDDSAALARIFDEPTAKIRRRLDGDIEPTTEMPRQDESDFDPTAELPQGALEEIFDPTGGMDDVGPGEIDPTLMEAFNEELETLDPDEMFATATHSAEDLAGAASIDALEVAIHDPLEDALPHDRTDATELGELPQGQHEDQDLTDALQEALNLLENDYEEDFTASQILERAALEESLREEAEQEEDDAEPKIV